MQQSIVHKYKYISAYVKVMINDHISCIFSAYFKKHVDILVTTINYLATTSLGNRWHQIPPLQDFDI